MNKNSEIFKKSNVIFTKKLPSEWMEATDFDLERPPFPEPFEAIEALDSLRSNFRGILNTTEIYWTL